MNAIKINGVTFDPGETGAVNLAVAPPAADAAESNYILIQTKGPLDKEQRRTLEAMSVKIQEYVSENTYLCRYEPSDLASIRSLPFVEWADVYHRGFKVTPSLTPGVPAGHIRSLAEIA